MGAGSSECARRNSCSLSCRPTSTAERLISYFRRSDARFSRTGLKAFLFTALTAIGACVCSEQPLDRQDRQQIDLGSLEPGRAGLGAVMDLAGRRALDPFKAATIGQEPHLV